MVVFISTANKASGDEASAASFLMETGSAGVNSVWCYDRERDLGLQETRGWQRQTLEPGVCEYGSNVWEPERVCVCPFGTSPLGCDSSLTSPVRGVGRGEERRKGEERGMRVDGKEGMVVVTAVRSSGH